MPGAQFQISSASKAETGLVVMATEYGEASKARESALEELKGQAIAGKMTAKEIEDALPDLPEFENLMFKGYSRIINVATETVETTITGSYNFGSRCEAIFDNAGDFLGPLIGKFTLSAMASAVECWWAPKIGQTMIEDFDTLLQGSVKAHGHLCSGQVIGVRMAMLGCKLIEIGRAHV